VVVEAEEAEEAGVVRSFALLGRCEPDRWCLSTLMFETAS